MNDFYHGSTSASFEGVFDPDFPGLKPVNELIRADKVPYCGELYSSLVEGGVNTNAISAVPAETIRGAIVYALRCSEGWTPEISLEKIAQHESQFKDLEASGEPIPDYVKNLIVEPAKKLIILERKRQERWKQIPELHKNLISKPFPVIYKIRYTGKIVPVSRTDYPLEVGIPATIPLPNLVTYVPRDKVDFTSSLINSPNKPQVRPFDDLKPLEEISLDVRTFIGLLLQG